MTIIGKSKAALAMIFDALSTIVTQNNVTVDIFDNLDIGGKFLYPNFRIDVYQCYDISKETAYFLGAVKPETKQKLVSLFDVRYEALINNNSFVSPQSLIGIGSIIDSNVSVAANAKIGKYVTFYANSSIAHDCNIGDFVTVCPNAAICGSVVIGEGTLIGAGAVIKNDIKIGKNCVIGAGSVVLNDVPDGVTVYGNPAKTKNKLAWQQLESTE